MGGKVSFPEYKPPRPSPEELEWARTFVRPNSVEARVWETVTDSMDDLSREIRNAIDRRHESSGIVAEHAGCP